MTPLSGFRAVNLAVNLPGPAAAARLRRMGAEVTKVEPPAGDPMARYQAAWYRDMAEGQAVLRLDLKDPAGRAALVDLLGAADLLLTATRPAALARIGLGWDDLHRRFPRLCQVAIVGHPAPDDGMAGHDLTYQASLGLLAPPHLPRTLLADMAGAESAVSAALALLLDRERSGRAGCAVVALSEAAAAAAEPLARGCTAPGALLGGGLPEYNLYRTADGWIAVAALEPHFKARLEAALAIATVEEYRRAFATRSSAEWDRWAREQDLPLAIVQGA